MNWFAFNRGAMLALASSLALTAHAAAAAATASYIRVDQLGYPAGGVGRAYLMSTGSEAGASFRLVDRGGTTISSGAVPSTSMAWGGFNVYALDFSTPRDGTFSLQVAGPAPAASPAFSVEAPVALYSAALANGLSFYQNERDGADFIPSPLRTAAGHLNDAQAAVYDTPTFNARQDVVGSLKPTGAVIDTSGGWWDAGDYMKFVETHSYAVAMMLLGVRDFPAQMGAAGPSDFTAEAQFGLEWLLNMWDDRSGTLYYQTAIGSVNSTTFGDHDIWRLPQADDTYGGTDPAYRYIRHRPVFIAAAAGSSISPNLAGRLAADFALCYQVFRTSDATLAGQCLHAAEHVFDLADTAPTGQLLTAAPYAFYPETEWRDDLELGASELYFALRAGAGALPPGLPHTDPHVYLAAAAQWAYAYITGPNDAADTLNLYDVSGVAHFELYRAITAAGSGSGLAVTQAQLLADLLKQLDKGETQAAADPYGFGFAWNQYDTATHGAGLSVTAAEYAFLTQAANATTDQAHWAGNILGANSWGASFIIGDGATFPDCPQHQVANLVGALDGSSPVLDGALVEGPNSMASYGLVSGMNTCPAGGGNVYAPFNGDGAVFKDNVQSYSTVEPAIDLTAPSLLMFSWLIAGTVATVP